MRKLQVHSLLESSQANGPGQRAVIWLQGCSLGCRGCWNPATHSRSGGLEFAIEDLVAWLHSVCTRTELSGLTISGGEPLEQAPALYFLLEEVRGQLPDLSIGLFSGYTERELKHGNYLCFPPAGVHEKTDLWCRILRNLDFAVLGRYNALTPASSPLVTSANQRLRLFGNRYSLTDFEPSVVEVTIDAAGLAQVTGFPSDGAIAR